MVIEKNKKYKAKNISSNNLDDFIYLAKFDKYIINKENDAKWFDFISSNIERNKDNLIILVNAIKDLGVIEFWINNSFLNNYESNPNNTLDELTAEYSIKKDSINHNILASNIIDKLEHKIQHWAQPKLFESAFVDLKNNLIKLNELLIIDTNNSLAAYGAIKQLDRLVEVFDLSIKTIQNSNFYDDKPQQVSNFNSLLGQFYHLMKDWVIDLEKIDQQEIDKRLAVVEEFYNTQQSKEIQLSGTFYCLVANFYQPYTYLFKEYFTSNAKTLGDFHTFIHQTLLSSISVRSKDINSKIISKLPVYLQDGTNELFEKFNYLFNNRTPFLVSANIIYPSVNLKYNIPIREHSGSVELIYNYEQDTTAISFSLVGFGDELWYGDGRTPRWDATLKYTSLVLFSKFRDQVKITKATSNVEFVLIEVELLKNEIIADIIQLFASLSYSTTHDGNKDFELDGDYLSNLKNQYGLSQDIFYSIVEIVNKYNYHKIDKIFESAIWLKNIETIKDNLQKGQYDDSVETMHIALNVLLTHQEYDFIKKTIIAKQAILNKKLLYNIRHKTFTTW